MRMLGTTVHAGRCYNPEDLRGCTVANRCCLVKSRSNRSLARFDRILAKPSLKASEWAWLARQLEKPKVLKLLLDRQEPENITGFPDEQVVKVPFHPIRTAEELDDIADHFTYTYELSSH